MAIKKATKKAVKKTVVKKLLAKKTRSKSSKLNVAELLKNAPKEKFPAKLTPMLATLVDKPFEEEGWLYEVKWDGYRALAFCNKNKVELKSRNDKSFND